MSPAQAAIAPGREGKVGLVSKLLNGVRPRADHHDGGAGPEPYIITPRDEFEIIGGKPTLLTDYQIDEIITAMRRTTHDPDLMAKMQELRAGT